ncbi:MAG: exodeoxyribonuclease VII large subunit [Xanthomonadales bacterium]|nr:Exodeoxyribonuclease 7 large subunit [Xanthomonadales bacterium]MCC6593116.1 exodeoxyribonuclease VII large subunit [Xanthomonadales bacterium]MCE7930276.1 exodeoxyribonuclease VII large subunit [Xanthomonadales bacterium PRO6]
MPSTPPDSAARARQVLSPSQLNRLARSLLEDAFGLVWVEAELSNFSRAASGHWYFTLKDSGAQLRAAMFRSNNLYVCLKPADGIQVLVRGRIGLYEARGDYQLIVEHMQEAGLGRLMREYERLRALLHAQGLTDPARKRPLPRMPRRIAVVTSPQGAAIRDVLAVCARRWPLLVIDLHPAQVQGAEAAAQLRAALAAALAVEPAYDLVLLTRGGGSLEDLAAFNDEALARAIAASPVPTVSAVGHETDTTLADLVADVRAPTPSAAAELIAPDGSAISARLTQAAGTLLDGLRRGLQARQQRADACERLLRAHDPRHSLALAHARAARLHDELSALVHAGAQARRRRLLVLLERLRTQAPQRHIARIRQDAALLLARLHQLAAHWLATPRRRIARGAQGLTLVRPDTRGLRARSAHALASLRQLGPQATLERGYVLLKTVDGGLITRASQLQSGQSLRACFADGERPLRSEEC